MTPSKYVTHEECMQNSKGFLPRWAIISIGTMILAVMGLLITLISYASGQSVKAIEKANQSTISTNKLANHVETHIQISNEKNSVLDDKLENILLILKDTNREQKLILEKLIRLEEQAKRP